jgi:hypothetical protein
VSISDETGMVVETVEQDQSHPAGRSSLPYMPDALPDGHYTVTLHARTTTGRTGTLQAQLSVDRTLSGVSVQPPAFSPNGDGIDDTITFSYQLAKQAYVTVEVVQNGRVLALVFQGTSDPGPYSVTWDGRTATGVVAPGHYEVRVTVVDDLAEGSQSAGFDVLP